MLLWLPLMVVARKMFWMVSTNPYPLVFDGNDNGCGKFPLCRYHYQFFLSFLAFLFVFGIFILFFFLMSKNVPFPIFMFLHWKCNSSQSHVNTEVICHHKFNDEMWSKLENMIFSFYLISLLYYFYFISLYWSIWKGKFGCQKDTYTYVISD